MITQTYFFLGLALTSGSLFDLAGISDHDAHVSTDKRADCSLAH